MRAPQIKKLSLGRSEINKIKTKFIVVKNILCIFQRYF